MAELTIAEDFGPETIELAGEGWGFEPGQFVSSPKGGSRAETNQLQTWAEWLATVPEEREWTVEGILPESGLAVVAGRAKEGKSTLVIHLARAVASGQNFLGLATKQKPVIYVNYEMPTDYLRSLLTSGDVPDKAHISNRRTPSFTPALASSLMHQIDGPGLMVIDSFRGAFKLPADGENSAGVAGVLLRRFQDLAVTKGWLILIIHHRNKKRDQTGSDSLSGTGDWTAAPDVIWTWVRSDPEKNGTLAIEGRIPPVEPFSVRLTPKECHCLGTSRNGQADNEKRMLLNSLAVLAKTADQLATELSIPSGTVRKRLAALEAEQSVRRNGAGKRNDPGVWEQIHSAQSPPLGKETKNRLPGRRVKWDLIPNLKVSPARRYLVRAL